MRVWHLLNLTFSRRSWRSKRIAERLAAIGRAVLQAVPAARFADDQPFRLTSLAFAQPDGELERHAILAALQAAGAEVTANNLWLLGWLGEYDKLAMTRRVLAEQYGLDIDAECDAVLYAGDFDQRRADVRLLQAHGGRQHRAQVPA